MRRRSLWMTALGLLVVAGCGGGASRTDSGGIRLTRVVGARYTLTAILPLPGDTQVTVTGLNNAGEVIGASLIFVPTPPRSPGGNSKSAFIGTSGADVRAQDPAPGVLHPFLVLNGLQTPLPTLPTDIGTRSTIPSAINDHGVIVGIDGGTPVIWRNGIPTPMRGLTSVEYLLAINNHDVVFGLDGQGYFLWNDGNVTRLPKAFNMVYGLNDAGVVLGQVSDQNLATAALWLNGEPTLLPRLPGSDLYLNTFAVAINNPGQVLGSAAGPQGDAAPYHLVVWQNGQVTDLTGVLGLESSTGVTINDNGQILGVRHPSTGPSDPFLYQNGAVTSLNALIPQGSGWTIESPIHLNNRVEILATGLHNGLSSPILLSPNGL